jgi:hypothetical protein
MAAMFPSPLGYRDPPADQAGCPGIHGTGRLDAGPCGHASTRPGGGGSPEQVTILEEQ